MNAAASAPAAGDRAIATDTLSIALMNPCYWPEVRRGAERFTRELANGLIDRGHRPRLITSHPGRPSSQVEDGMPVLRLWRPPDRRLTRRAYEDYLTHVPLSYVALRVGNDDLAQALAAPEALAAIRWSRHSGRPVVFSYMGIPTRHYLASRRHRAEMTLEACRGASAVTSLSRAAADGFRECLGIETRVIHPGVDLDAFTPSGPRSPEPLIFCGASLDVEYKRVDMLIRALPLVRRARPGARLRLFSPVDPRRAARLEHECEGLELIDNDPALLADSYRLAWVSALPSRGEAFGLVLTESLACGTPVVGTASGGIPEVIDDPEIGATFDGDESALARALLEVLELADDPQTASACRRHAERFSVQRTAAAYEQLYVELLADRHQRA